MPDLGTYAFAVLSSYGASVALIGALVIASLVRARRARDALRRAEALEGRGHV